MDRVATTGIGVAVFGVAGSAMLADSLSRNVRILSQFASRVSRGDLSQYARLEKRSTFPDEVDALASSINYMLDNLRELVSTSSAPPEQSPIAPVICRAPPRASTHPPRRSPPRSADRQGRRAAGRARRPREQAHQRRSPPASTHGPRGRGRCGRLQRDGERGRSRAVRSASSRSTSCARCSRRSRRQEPASCASASSRRRSATSSR